MLRMPAPSPAGRLTTTVLSVILAGTIVLAQPSISSQVIDNLNASIHLRALLTDLFLVDEVLKGQKA